MTVTIDDIATQTGVSRITVSRALRGVGRMSDETRERVLSTAQALNYRPNSHARAISTGRFNALGLLLDTHLVRSEISPQFIHALTEAAERRNQRLILGRLSEQDLQEPDTLPKLLQEWSVDAFLVNFHLELPRHIDAAIDTANSPRISLNLDSPVGSVCLNDFQAGTDMTNALIAAGHRDIAYVDFSYYHRVTTKRHYSRTARLEGYTAAMKNAGLAPRACLDTDETDRDDSVRRLHELITGETPPTAVMSYARSTVSTINTICIACPDVPRPAFGYWSNELTLLDNSVLAVVPWGRYADTAIDVICKAVDAGKRYPASVKVSYDMKSSLVSRGA